MSQTKNDIALELAAMAGELAAVVAWCIDHADECLADNPYQLATAKRLLAKARDWMPKDAADD